MGLNGRHTLNCNERRFQTGQSQNPIYSCNEAHRTHSIRKISKCTNINKKHIKTLFETLIEILEKALMTHGTHLRL